MTSKRTISPPTCLLWDVDGTMVDTTALIVASLDHVYLRFYDRTLPTDALRALIGTPLSRQIRVFGEPEAFGVTEQEITQEFIRYYEAHRDEERILNEVIALVIEGRRRGLPTALVTSKNRQELTNTLPRLGIAEHIDLAVTADDVSHPKPDPEGLRLALTRLGISAELWPQSVYIGDTVHDMRAAHAAGVTPIAVTWGAATPPQIAAEAPAALCDTPSALRDLLFPDASSF